MGMTIYVQKLSNPSEEWSIDAESSDVVLGIKMKLVHEQIFGGEPGPPYSVANVRLFFNSVELLDGNVLSDYGIVKDSHITSSHIIPSSCEPIFEKFAYGDEDGCERFRRLRLLGYL
jgi:hypothetical protein